MRSDGTGLLDQIQAAEITSEQLRPFANGDDWGRPPKCTKVGRLIPVSSGTQLVTQILRDLIADGVVNPPYRYMIIASADHSAGQSGPQLYFSNSLDVDSFQPLDDVHGDWTAAGFTVPDTTNPVSVTSYPGGIGNGEYFTGELNEARDGYIWFGHSNGLTGVGGSGSSRQTQWRFTSTLAQPLVFTYENYIDGPRSVNDEHTGGYSVYQKDGGILFSHGLTTGIAPIQCGLTRSADDGEHWFWQGLGLQFTYPTIFGKTDKQLVANMRPFRWRGQNWAIAVYRDIPGSGGALVNGDAVVIRLSDDLRRYVGFPFEFVSRGDSGEWDADEIVGGALYTMIDPDDPNTVLVIYSGRGTGSSAGDTGSVGLAKIDLTDVTHPSRAVAIEAGYETVPAAYNNQGLLEACGPNELRTVYEKHFGDSTTQPSELVSASGNLGTVTLTKHLASDGGTMTIESSGGSAECVYLNYGLNFANLAEAWWDVSGIKSSGDNIGIQIGFADFPTEETSSPSAYGDNVALFYFSRDTTGSGTSQPQIYLDNGSAVTRDYLNHWPIAADNRYLHPVNLSFGVRRHFQSEGSADRWYAVLMTNDQTVKWWDITANFVTGTILYPKIRIFRLTGTGNVSLTCRGVRLRLAEKYV